MVDFLQAYGEMPFAPLARGLFGEYCKIPFISSALHVRVESEEDVPGPCTMLC